MAREPRFHFQRALKYNEGQKTMRVAEAARHFQRSPMRTSQAVFQFWNQLRKDDHLRKTIDKLKEGLIKKGKKKNVTPIAWLPGLLPAAESGKSSCLIHNPR